MTKKFVMWLHADSPHYKKAAAGVAVADSIMGEWTVLGDPCTGPDAENFLWSKHLCYPNRWQKECLHCLFRHVGKNGFGKQSLHLVVN